MPFIPLADTKEYTITPQGVDEDDPIVVSFKQATEGENAAREEALQSDWFQEYDKSKGADYHRVAIGMTLERERVATEIFLTLTACNIEVPAIKQGEYVTDKEGNVKSKPLFKFSEVNGRRKLIGTIREFRTKLDTLPSQWVDEIHEKCIITNPYWSPAFLAMSDEEREVYQKSIAPGE